jgi:hypothetical protein
MATKAEQLGEEVVKAVRSFVKLSLAKRDQRLDTLEKMLREIESQTKAFRYVGTWEAGRTYARGNFATFAGSVWSCKRDTTTRPGDGDAWQLAVKAGRDGRDLR